MTPARPATRTAVVTGGGTGIGRAVAARLAAEGADVVVVGRRAEVLEATAAALGPRASAVRCDLTDPGDVARAAALLPGRVDVLVANAGGRDRRPGTGLADVRDRWLGDFTANVLTAVLLVEALQDRLAAPGGRVVTIGSIAAWRGNDSYGAAKAALHAWNHSLAARLGPRGITANVVVPGVVAGTEFFGTGGLSEADRAQRAAATLVGRIGTPDDVAACVAYLASPDAGYLTGQLVSPNGGAILGR